MVAAAVAAAKERSLWRIRATEGNDEPFFCMNTSTFIYEIKRVEQQIMEWLPRSLLIRAALTILFLRRNPRYPGLLSPASR